MGLRNVHSKENLSKTWQQDSESKGEKTMYIKLNFPKTTLMALAKQAIVMENIVGQMVVFTKASGSKDK